MLSALSTLYINVGEMWFIPMNVYNELFNGVRQLRWQHLSPVVSTFSTSSRLLSFFFLKHCILPPSSLSVPSICLSFYIPFSQLVVFPCGLEMLINVFFLQSKVLCRKTHSLSSDWQ